MMEYFKKAFALLQQIGKSLMLPVSVLPVAGILLGVGSSVQNSDKDFFAKHAVHQFPWTITTATKIMADSGDAIFHNLPIIFAIGVALGLTGNDGVSALAAVVGYVVMVATMGVMAGVRHLPTSSIIGMDSLDTGVFGGIIVGAVAAYLFNRYYRIKLPSYLGFFAGKRFVPIVTAFSTLAIGLVLSYLWPPIQSWIQDGADQAARSNPAAAVFLYGIVERMLIPFGLHHIWNVPFFFQIGSYTPPGTTEVIHGEMNRFFKGDPTAGILGGGFLFKMWGLPAAAIAIWHCAKPERRAEVGSIMLSGALTSFLTGITEPIEFAFMFVAPVLYAMHALLAGFAFLVMESLGTHLGYTFSQGFIDYALYFAMDTKPWLVLVIGPIYALVYYVAFRFVIQRFDLKTPGREDVDVVQAVVEGSGADSLAGQILAALGGASNLTNLDACITRLRVGLVNIEKANPGKLKALGAAGVMVVGNGMQAIFGTASENIKTDIEQLIKAGGASLAAAPVEVVEQAAVTVPLTSRATQQAEKVLACLGGAANVQTTQPVALTRIRVVVSDAGCVDVAGLEKLGMTVMPLKEGTFHLIVGTQSCQEDAAALKVLVQR